MIEVAIREYRQGDHRAIAEIFPRAVHEIASKNYTLEQCLAWSGREPNPGHWEKRCARKQPLVAVVEGEIAGFLELDPDGHIDCAYIHPKYQRRGIMTRLVEQAVKVSFARGVQKVYVEASIGAKPLFEKCGFKVVAESVVTIKGVELLNYRMEKMKE